MVAYLQIKHIGRFRKPPRYVPNINKHKKEEKMESYILGLFGAFTLGWFFAEWKQSKADDRSLL